MNKTVRNILIAVTVPTVLLGAYFGYKYIKGKMNTSTSEQFNTIVKNFTKVGADVFDGIAPSKMNELFANFQKNITKEEADDIIKISVKRERDMTASEIIQMTSFFKEILNSKSNKA